MDDNVPGFIKINQKDGFNYLNTPVGKVEFKQELFLRRNGDMISLGTYNQAKNRAGPENSHVIGIDGTDYGHFGSPAINNNLFISVKLPPPPGQRNIPKLDMLARQALSSDDYEALRQSGFHMPPPGKISYSNGSNQNAGNFKHRKSRSRKSRSRKCRSRKSRSRKSRSR